MRSPQGDSGKKCANVSHNRIERNHCRINVPEVLNQVIGNIKFLNIWYRGVKGGRGRAKEVFFLRGQKS